MRTVPHFSKALFTWLSSVFKASLIDPILNKNRAKGMAAKVVNCIMNCSITSTWFSAPTHIPGKSHWHSKTMIMMSTNAHDAINSVKRVFLVSVIVN